MSCNCQATAWRGLSRKLPAPPPSFRTRVLTGLSLLGGLLSSSCCTIQLIFNLLHLGCAGFAILTPWKTHFRTLTVLALAHLLYRDGFNRRSLLTAALTISLIFSQDAVRLHNLYTGLSNPAETDGNSVPSAGEAESHSVNSRGLHSTENTPLLPKPRSSASCAPPPTHRNDTHTYDQDDIRSNSTGHAPEPGLSGPTTPGRFPSPGQEQSERSAGMGGTPEEVENVYGVSKAIPMVGVYLRFQVAGIKCEGCAARLKAAVSRLPGVQRCAVDFMSGQVLVWGAPGAALEAEEVRGVIQFVDLSYKATLVEHRGL